MTWATSVGDKAMLLKHGVDINTADKSGNTPLLNAQGQHQMAQMLLDRKANVEAKLHRAVMRDNEVLVELQPVNADAVIDAPVSDHAAN